MCNCIQLNQKWFGIISLIVDSMQKEDATVIAAELFTFDLYQIRIFSFSGIFKSKLTLVSTFFFGFSLLSWTLLYSINEKWCNSIILVYCLQFQKFNILYNLKWKGNQNHTDALLFKRIFRGKASFFYLFSCFFFLKNKVRLLMESAHHWKLLLRVESRTRIVSSFFLRRWIKKKLFGMSMMHVSAL